MRTPTCLLAALLLSAASAPASTFSVSGSGNSFTISRNGDTSAAETVLYRTVPLSAFPGQHYTAKSGTLAFAPYQTSTNVVVSESSPTAGTSYAYQTTGSRAYRFEVTDANGFPLVSRDRSRNVGTQFTATKVSSSIANLVTMGSSGSFSSGMASSKYLDVAYTPPSGQVETSGTLAGYVLIDDSYDYAEKPASVSTADLIASTGATASYLNSLGYKIYATVCFAEKERDDGYQYLQIVAGTSAAAYDGADPNGSVNDPVNSVYKVCFELSDGSNAEGNAFFPHRYSSGTGEFGLSTGKLHEQKYKSGYQAGSSGSVVLPVTTAYITTRFDAGGDNDDTWGYKDLFVRMALCDATAPALYGNSTAGIAVAPGTYAVGSTVYVSVPFKEIVRVTGTPTLSTTWGTLSYVTGDGSNVLTFEGRIEAKPGDTLAVNSLSGTVRDLAGNALANPLAINRTFSSCVAQIPWDGSGTEADPYLILSTGQLDALAILVNAGTDYSGTHFALGADLAYPHTTAWNDASSTENNFTPVGSYSKSFGGHFHGNGHTVSGIRIYRSGDTHDKGDSSLALFGYASGGSVRDVVVADANVSGYDYCGAVVGYNGATVTNCLAFNVRVAGRAASSAGAVAGYHDTNPSASRLLSNHYRDCTANGASLGIGTGSRGDLPGARSLHLLDLDPTVSASADDTALVTNVLYYAAAASVSLSYGGTPPFGYVLAGYDTNSVALPDDVSSFAMPAADISVAPRFKRDTYTIEWRNDADAGSALLATTAVLYEDTPAYPDDAPVPAKPSTAQFDYAFADAWSPAPAPATSNATYTALYTSAIRSYDVVWLDGDGAPLLTNRLDYGSTPAYPADAPVPAKSATPQYTYAFAGSWSPAIAPVSGPAAYTAAFSAIPVTNGCCGLLSENGGSNLLWRVEDTDRNGTFDTLFVCTNPAAASGADFSMRDYGSRNDLPWLHSVGTLERVVVCDGVATVGANAFSGFRSVRDVSFPEGLVNVGSGAFSSCVALSSVSLPESIRTLCVQAFSGCTGLRRVDIPTGIDELAFAAFAAIGSAEAPAHVWYRGTETMWEYAGGPLALAPVIPPPTHAVLHFAAPVSVDPAVSGGTVAADLAYAFEGETVTLSVVPADGFVVGAVGYATGSVLHAVAPAAGGVYAFAMPPAAATATATFRAPVQFLDEDGATVLQSGPWDCGATPAFTNAAPTKAPDAAYAYFFSGWEPAVAPVSGPASYTATFAPTSHWALLSDALAAGGTVVLSRDVAATADDTALTVPSGVAVTLDLAGHTIDRALAQPAPSGEAIRVGGSLALTNSVPASGAITGGNTAFDFEDYSSFGNGGGVYVEDGGAFTMTGGAISGNAAVFDGGGVYVEYGGTFTMNGGAISGNSAGEDGGGVSVNNGGAFTMNGGGISGNSAESKGGGVLVWYGGDFAMSGGEISGNAAGQDGGGVYLHSSSDSARLRISGAPRVLGNVVTNFSDAAAPAAANDIDFSHADSLLQVVGDLAPGARLGIVPDVRRAVTTNLLGHAAGADGGLSLFFSDDPEYTLALDADGEVCVVPPSYALSYVPQDHVAVSVWSVAASDPDAAADAAGLGLAPASFAAAFSPDEPFALRLDFDPGWFLDLASEDPVLVEVPGSDESLSLAHGDFRVLLDGATLYLVCYDGPRAPATLALSLAPFSRTVTFQNVDGTVLQTGPVGYGIVPTYTNATPVLADPDERHYYVFSGWTPAPAPVLLDLDGASAAPVVYTAAYELRDKFAVVVDPNLAHGSVEVLLSDWSSYSAPVPAATKLWLLPSVDPGYGVVSLSVAGTNGIPVEANADGSFTMPAFDVTVSATFDEALPIFVERDEAAQDAINGWSFVAGGALMDSPSAAPGAVVELDFYMASFLFAPNVAVATTNGAEVAFTVSCADEAAGSWTVRFMMPAEPVVVTISVVPATFDSLVLLPATNTVDAASRVFSFVPQETGVYRFALDDGDPAVCDSHAQRLFYGNGEASGALLAGETCYVVARVGNSWDWDGASRPLVAERTGDATPHSVSADPSIVGGTVQPSHAAAPENYIVYATPDPAPGYDYVEDSIRYVCGGETNELQFASDGTPGFRMPAADVVLTADFEPIPFAVTVDPDIEHGTVGVYVVTSGGGAGILDKTVPYSGPVAVGTMISLSASPDAGYGFASWSVVDASGVPVAVDERGFFAMPASDVTVSATFAEAFPISVEVDESVQVYWSVDANGIHMDPAAAVPGAAVELRVYPGTILLSPTAVVTTTNGTAVASAVVCLDEANGEWAVSFTMPAEPVVVALSVVPATFDTLVLLPATNTVDAASRVFSFVPEETGVYRFAMDGGFLGVVDCRGEYFFAGEDEASGALLAGETYYVCADIYDWDGTPRPLVAERTGGTFTLHSVAVAPDIAHGTVSTSHDSAPEYHPVYATPVPAPGYAYVEGSLRYIVGGETNELGSAPDGTPVFQMPAADVLVTAEFEPIPFAVTVDPDIEHGWIWLLDADFGMIEDTDPVFVGTKIWAYPVPDRGYGVVSLSVVDTSGAPVEVDEWGYFTMPASDVTVSATFAEALPITVLLDAAAQDAIDDWSVSANGIWMNPPAAASGAAVSLDVSTSSFLFAPTVVVATTNGNEVACDTECYDEANGFWYVRFTMPAEPVVVSLSAVPATFEELVLLPATNTVDKADRVFSFVPQETGVYRFAMDDSVLVVYDRHGESLLYEYDETSGTLLAGETYYVYAVAGDWDGTPRFLVAEKLSDQVVLYSVSADPSIAHGTVVPGVAAAPENYRVYPTPVPAPGYAYVEGSLRYVCGDETYELSTARDGTPCFRMPADDVLVTAEFEPIPFAVTVDPDIAHGTVKVYVVTEEDGMGSYSASPYTVPVPAGTRIQLSASPDPGYGLAAWSVGDTNGVPVAVGEWGIFTMPASDVTVSATFAEALPITLQIDEFTASMIGDGGVLANDVYMATPAAVPGATVKLWVAPSFVFAPTATVVTASGAPVEPPIEFLYAGEGEWGGSFTMPAEPVVVTLSLVPADYPALHEGANEVDAAWGIFVFTPETTGCYAFVAGENDYIGICDSSGDYLDDFAGSFGLMAGERYYVTFYADGDEGHDIVVTRTADAYAVTVDPAIEHGTVEVYDADSWNEVSGPVPAGTEMYLEFTPHPAYGLASLSVVAASGVPVAVDDNGIFAMPASDVTVSATFARAKSITVVEDENAKRRINWWQCYAGGVFADPTAAAPGAEVMLWIEMMSRVFAPTASVATAGGAEVETSVEYVQGEDHSGWSVRFTMPAEPVVVSLSAGPADYPPLHEGANVVDPPYRSRTFAFTPETNGYYSFVAAGSSYCAVVDSFGAGMGVSAEMCSVPFLAGERYYVFYSEQEGATEHTIVISMVGDPVATYAVAVDPSIAGGSVTSSVLRAAEGCRVYLTVTEDADTILGTLRATWTNGTETVELKPSAARKLRVKGLRRNTGYGISLFSLSVYGS